MKTTIHAVRFAFCTASRISGHASFTCCSVTSAAVVGVAVGVAAGVTSAVLAFSAAEVSLPTGTAIGTVASLGYLPDFTRAPVNLVLGSTLAPLPAAPYSPPTDLTPLPPQVTLSIGAGATIQADPGAAISLSVAGRLQATRRSAESDQLKLHEKRS